MKLVTFRQTADHNNKNGHLGVLADSVVSDLSQVGGAPRTMAEACALGADAVSRLTKWASDAPRLTLAEVTLLAPFPRPARNVFCVGKNYHEHAAEFAKSGFDSTAKEVVPEAPVVFTKPPSAVIGPGDAIPGHLDTTDDIDKRFVKTFAIILPHGRPRGKERSPRMQAPLRRHHRRSSFVASVRRFCPCGFHCRTRCSYAFSACSDPSRSRSRSSLRL